MQAEEVRYFRTVSEVTRAINSTLDTREVLSAIVQGTAKAVSVKGCSLMLLSRDRQILQHVADHGLSDWYVRKGPVTMDSDMAAALRGRAVAVLDASHDPRVQYPGQAAREGIASMLSVPVRLRDEVIGVMRLYTAEPRQFDGDETEFVETIANLGAIALENARRYEQVKDSYDVVCQELLTWYADRALMD